MAITTYLLKINKIVGMFYQNDISADTLVIYGLGAPVVPDNGSLPDAPYILKFKVDLFVPDYIGYGRSEGTFTPTNCIKTFTELYTHFSQDAVGKNTYLNKKIFLKYRRIIIMGKSFAGTYIPVLTRFCPDIKELAIFCPAVDTKNCGSVTGEETNALFLQSMKEDGYYHLYRGILTKKWADHLENMDNLSPLENIGYLENVKLFIAHGKKDVCVHFSKSRDYFKKIKTHFPSKEGVLLRLYESGDHGVSTTNRAVIESLEWFGVEKKV